MGTGGRATKDGRRGDAETRRHGDQETGSQGGQETRRQGHHERVKSKSPRPRVPASPRPRVPASPRLPSPRPSSAPSETKIVFQTALGWMALRLSGAIVRQLTFGHPSAAAAARAIGAGLAAAGPKGWWQENLVCRLRAYAQGLPIDFHDCLLDLSGRTPFERRVLRLCREIPYGRTTTYGRLALRARSPRAARAVGRCMAANPLPLLIPCHRVVPAAGPPGHYSAPGGSRMKRRLLDLESRARSAAAQGVALQR